MKISTFLGAAAASALLIVSAQAADVFVAEVVEAPAPAPAASWDGVFIGLHTGYGWTDTTVSRTGNIPAPDMFWGISPDGVLGGLQVGYNYQHNNLLFGVIGDISMTGMSDTGAQMVPPGNLITWETEYDWLATIRARGGWLWNDQTLFYAHGGVAFTDVTTPFVTSGGPMNGVSLGGSETGWVAGAGVETKISDMVSFFAEYSYIDFGSSSSVTFNPPGPPTVLTYTVDNDPINAIKIGFNVKLWSPGN
ncbi:MAG: porin family protein [Hyphomicrobiales bacterium]|nr:porin family protein [Hyphomicrobiales bacterium]MCP5093193.1 porin family protein [Gammaproteobacteria bacterium]